jgi:RNA polymerase primary sigma factor
LIRSATERGYATHGQIDALLSRNDVKFDQDKNVLAKFTETSMSVRESGKDTDIEAKDDRTTGAEPNGGFETTNELIAARQVSTMQPAKAPAERTDDPLRSYLRDMDSIELLSREGELQSPSVSRPAARR